MTTSTSETVPVTVTSEPSVKVFVSPSETPARSPSRLPLMVELDRRSKASSPVPPITSPVTVANSCNVIVSAPAPASMPPPTVPPAVIPPLVSIVIVSAPPPATIPPSSTPPKLTVKTSGPSPPARFSMPLKPGVAAPILRVVSPASSNRSPVLVPVTTNVSPLTSRVCSVSPVPSPPSTVPEIDPAASNWKVSSPARPKICSIASN